MKMELKAAKIDKQEIKFPKKSIFLMKEKKSDKTMYHTKILKTLYKVINKKNQCIVLFRKLYNELEIKAIKLYSIKEGDKFLGIYYGYRKPINNVLVKYEINGVEKVYTFSKAYYIEFRFKAGSIFCYLKDIFRLLKKEKIDTPYNKALVYRLIDLEKHVYEFYNKKYSGEGLIIKWILKNLK
ncbi:DUF226 domain-containing protein [Borreliella bissettiae]|uniref:DUF226 domain-containing protein n=1 Tax=Borrelia bissettiae TaxID=64897 RepID=UPI001E5D9998|nr:DUF226 domain-containing protein [Borreliella bissettiae]MCD2401635.1 DUF226 domain-containing protein [Borreliella bissettiae]